jgi:hypothetical protein
MRDQRRAGICEDPECPRHRMSPSVIKGQNPDTGLDECMTCYQRRRRREQGYVAPDAVKLNKRVAKSRNKIEEGLLDLGFSPAEATETINEIANRCSALYRFIHGLGPSDDVVMPTDVNVNIQDEPEQDEEEAAVDTEHDVNVNIPPVPRNEIGSQEEGEEVDVDTSMSPVNSEPTIETVSDQLVKEGEKKDGEERWNKVFPELAKGVQEVLAEAHGLTASRIPEAVNAKLGRKDYDQQEFYRGLKEGVGKKLWVKVNAKYYLNANNGNAGRRKALVLEVLQRGKSLGSTQLMAEIEKNPGWEKWGTHDEYYQAMKLGIGSDWFKRGSLYNIAPGTSKNDLMRKMADRVA